MGVVVRVGSLSDLQVSVESQMTPYLTGRRSKVPVLESPQGHQDLTLSWFLSIFGLPVREYPSQSLRGLTRDQLRSVVSSERRLPLLRPRSSASESRCEF